MMEYISELDPNIKDFITFKNALGIGYKTSSFYLKDLDRYNYSHGNYSTLTKEIAEGWATQQAEKSTGQGVWEIPSKHGTPGCICSG